MRPQNRLENISLEALGTAPVVTSFTKTDYDNVPQPRCDAPSCYCGCQTADPKQPQRDLKIYCQGKAA